MIGYFIKCTICPATVMFAAPTCKAQVRAVATKDGWKCGRNRDLCPKHAAEYDQLAERMNKR